MDCLEDGRNHCLVSEHVGVCCDKGDSRCGQTAKAYLNGKFCASTFSHNRQTSYLSCPTTHQCPQEKEMNLGTYNKLCGTFSDSWAANQYSSNSICKFRVFTDHKNVDISMKVTSIVGNSKIMVYVMSKNANYVPYKTHEVMAGTGRKFFMVRGQYMEYQVLVIPDTTISGSFRADFCIQNVQGKQV